MKVYLTVREGKKYDVRVKRTRRSEGDTQRAKGLTLAELRVWTEKAIDEVQHPSPPEI